MSISALKTSFFLVISSAMNSLHRNLKYDVTRTVIKFMMFLFQQQYFATKWKILLCIVSVSNFEYIFNISILNPALMKNDVFEAPNFIEFVVEFVLELVECMRS